MFKGTLRPYQEEAVNKMVDRGQQLLGLVMGAGKTPTSLAAIEMLHDLQEVDRCLVVVPASLKFQWKDEIKKFTDATVTIIDGSVKQRQASWRASTSTRYTIINPESLVRDLPILAKHQFNAIIVDEATILKNRAAKRTRALKKIGKAIPYRFALTGQPIENKPEELFSLMEFVDPRVLGTFKEFDDTYIVRDYFGKPIRYKNLDKMRTDLADVLVRKTRADIADQLPQVIHTTIPVPFDDKGADLYRYIAGDLLAQIASAVATYGKSFNIFAHYNGGEGGEAQGQIMSRLTVLRMLCDNPELVRISAESFVDQTTTSGSKYAAELQEAGWLNGLTEAPKLSAVVDYIEEILDEDPNNKVVLFSFFKENLRLIQKHTKHLTNSVLFMGGMDAPSRDAAKKKFQTDPNTRLFLSSDAGGYGVDLPMANFLISYDLPWSSGKLEQREARIIRLSSEFPHVTIATFVMQGSIEERQYEMLQQKRTINEAFVDGQHHDAKSGLDVSLGSLTSFLKNSEV